MHGGWQKAGGTRGKSNDKFIEVKNYYYVAFFRPQNFHLIHASFLFEVFLRLINLSLHR